MDGMLNVAAGKPITVTQPDLARRWRVPSVEELSSVMPARYQIESLIGSGGMAAVYRAHDLEFDLTVAIKVLPAELAASQLMFERFKREARTLAKLNHPGIVRLYDVGQSTAGHAFIVMEFVNGTDLHRVLHPQDSAIATLLDTAMALKITIQVCEALQYAHEQGIAHRDIKPSNILITTGSGLAKLSDFGLARPLSPDHTRLTATQVTLGTPSYMAPEQKRGEPGDHRADIYSLGVTLFEMLTGKLPAGFELPSRRRSDLDVRLDAIVARAMLEEPDRRYSQVSELHQAVEDVRTTPPRSARRIPVRSMLALLMVAGLTAAMVPLWKLVSQPANKEVASIPPAVPAPALPSLATASPVPPASISTPAPVPPLDLQASGLIRTHGGIILHKDWLPSLPVSGIEPLKGSIADLTHYAKAATGETASPAAPQFIVSTLRWLMPMEEAIRALPEGAELRPSGNLAPWMPAGSLTVKRLNYDSFPDLGESFGTIELIGDAQGQLISVRLTNAGHPGLRHLLRGSLEELSRLPSPLSESWTPSIHDGRLERPATCIDFLYGISTSSAATYQCRFSSTGNAMLLRMNSPLGDSFAKDSPATLLDGQVFGGVSHWYLPSPFARVLLEVAEAWGASSER